MPIDIRYYFISKNSSLEVSNDNRAKVRTSGDDCVGQFHEGLAAVYDSKNHQQFHILRDETPAYSERYDGVWDFSEGLAAADIKGARFHIFHNGKPAYKERYLDVKKFSEGLAVAMIDFDVYCHIRSDGKPAYKKRYVHVGPFSEGLAAVRTKGGRCFHIFPDGKPAYAERYSYVGDFWNGHASVKKDGKDFFIHRDGSIAGVCRPYKI